MWTDERAIAYLIIEASELEYVVLTCPQLRIFNVKCRHVDIYAISTNFDMETRVDKDFILIKDIKLAAANGNVKYYFPQSAGPNAQGQENECIESFSLLQASAKNISERQP
jgi:hypothetical protein